MKKQKPNHTDTFIQTMQRQTEEHHAVKCDIHTFKVYKPRPLPCGIEDRIAEYRAIPSLFK